MSSALPDLSLDGPAPVHQCANCGATAPGRFCAECGQATTSSAPSMRELAREFVEEHLGYDSKTARTVTRLVLRLLYARTGRVDVEHFIFALHVHASAFLVFAVGSLWANPVWTLALGLWLLGYLLVAMRRVYAQSWRLTVLEYGLAWALYMPLVVAGRVVSLAIPVLFG